MASKIVKAYWGSGSAPARVMLLGLEEKGIKYESKMVSFSKGEQKGPEIVAINPRAKVPTLLDGDVGVYESLAIVHYLERNYPEHPLIPTGAKESAEALTRMHEVSYLSDNISALARHNNSQDKNDAWKIKFEELKGKVLEEITFWDKTIKGKYITGDNVTVADVVLFPYIDVCVRFGATFDKFPKLNEYHKLFSCRPSAVASYPPHWKEGPGPKIF